MAWRSYPTFSFMAMSSQRTAGLGFAWGRHAESNGSVGKAQAPGAGRGSLHRGGDLLSKWEPVPSAPRCHPPSRTSSGGAEPKGQQVFCRERAWSISSGFSTQHREAVINHSSSPGFPWHCLEGVIIPLSGSSISLPPGQPASSAPSLCAPAPRCSKK